MCLDEFSITSQKAQLRAPLSPSKQPVFTSRLQLWWKAATTRSITLNRVIMTDMMPAKPTEPGWCAVHSTSSRLLTARSVPCASDGLNRPVGIDCKRYNSLAGDCLWLKGRWHTHFRNNLPVIRKGYCSNFMLSLHCTASHSMPSSQHCVRL